MKTANNNNQQLLIIDNSINGWQKLVRERAENTCVMILETRRDELREGSEKLPVSINDNGYLPVQSIQITVHGSLWNLSLVSSSFKLTKLNEHNKQLLSFGINSADTENFLLLNNKPVATKEKQKVAEYNVAAGDVLDDLSAIAIVGIN